MLTARIRRAGAGLLTLSALVAGVTLSTWTAPAVATPRVPVDDDEIVERLPAVGLGLTTLARLA